MDDKIGVHGGKKPKLTIGGYPNLGQYRMLIGIGNRQYVVFGANDRMDEKMMDTINALRSSVQTKRVKRDESTESNS